jgi:hypothetical protein
MAISASQIATTNTLEQFRTEFNILRDDVSGLEDGSVTFSEISATTLGSSTINVEEDGTIVFEGATDNANETTLTVIDPTGDHTITFPDQTGLVSLIGGIKTNADDDIVLDDSDGRLLLEDVMDGDTGSFLSLHGITFLNNDVSLSGTLAVTGIATFTDDIIIGDGKTIGSASDTDSLSISSAGVVNFTQRPTFAASLTIQDGGSIGSASDLNAVTISSGGVVAVTATTANTGASDGALTVAGGAGIAADLSVGDDLRLISDSAVLSFGADSDTTLTHTDGTGLTLNSTNKLTFGDAATFIHQSSNGVMTIDGEATIDLNASTAVLVSNDLKLNSDAAVLGFGADNDVTLTHAADTSLTLNVLMAATTFEPTGDTAAGDNAALGYTSVLGAILTGQGSTNDVTLVNDADATVLGIPTGTINVTMAGTLDVVGDITGSTLNADGDTAAGDAAAIGYTAAEGLILTGQGSTSDVVIKNDADVTVMSIATGTDDVVFAGDVTVSGNLDVTGTFDLSDSNFTNAGDIQLDSITGDGDTNTSITFSGSDIITFATGGSTAATLNASQVLTLSGNMIIPDAGTIGSASDTNAISISSGGVVAVTATTANTSASDGALTVAGGAGIAADLSVGDDVRLISDAAVLSFGADSDVTLTHVADTGLLLNGAMAIQFRDSAISIASDNDGDLMIAANDEIDITSTLIDINGNVEISGELAQVGVATFTARDIHSGGITIANDGQIGSVGDADSIAISSAGVVTFSQSPVFPDGSIAIVDLDIDGGTDIGAALTTSDLIIVDDGAGGTNRKAALSRLVTLMAANLEDPTALAIALG